MSHKSYSPGQGRRVNKVSLITLNPSKIEGDTITAECANEPRDIPNLEMGQVRELSTDLVSDWMLIVGKKCYGGYTLQVTIKVQPELAKQIPYEFVDPE